MRDGGPVRVAGPRRSAPVTGPPNRPFRDISSEVPEIEAREAEPWTDGQTDNNNNNNNNNTNDNNDNDDRRTDGRTD